MDRTETAAADPSRVLVEFEEVVDDHGGGAFHIRRETFIAVLIDGDHHHRILETDGEVIVGAGTAGFAGADLPQRSESVGGVLIAQRPVVVVMVV